MGPRIDALIDDRFELEERAGSGGMGLVYRAVDRSTGQLVAIKILGHQNDSSTRFLREAQLLSELRHPAIVAYLARGVLPSGEPYLVMEWLDGEDLERRLNRGSLLPSEAVALVARVADALSFAHRRGIIHRDIKPSNLFLRGGKLEDIVLLDFGLARALGGSTRMTHTGAVMGTPAYMAPEQARGQHDIGPPADIFSLGCVLYECLAGQSPFVADHPMAVMAKILFSSAPPIRSSCPALPASVADLIERMLARDPAERFADAPALADALKGLDLGPGSTRSGGSLSARPSGVLTAGEQRLVSVVVASPPRVSSLATTLIATDSARLNFLENDSMKALRARTEWLADGSLVATLDEWGASADDQAVQAARYALALHERWPEACVVLATGRGVVGNELPIGEALERAAKLLSAPGDSSSVRVDSLSAALLQRRFTLTDDAGITVLEGERINRDEAHRLLGKPTPCVGRDQELALLQAALTASLEEPCARAVLVTGPPGAGKSRLRHELLRRLREDDGPSLQILLSQGDPVRLDSPYGLLAEALLRLCDADAGDRENERRSKLAARLGLHVPEGDRRRVVAFLAELCRLGVPDTDVAALKAARQNPAQMIEQIRLALCDFLRAECQSHGILWVLEDLHWADSQSVTLLGDVLHDLGGQPILLVALARPEMTQRFPRLWGGLRQHLPLRALGKRASERLVREILGADVPAAEVSHIVEQAGGNVLFLEELIRARAEGDGDHDGVWVETVLAVLQARFTRLPPAVRRVLRAASVFGHHFWTGGVQALLGVPEEMDQVPRACQILLGVELIERVRQSRLQGEVEYRFRHALMRDAAYALLTEEDRITGHRLAGWYLEQAGETDPMVLIDHYRRGMEPARVLPLLFQAGDTAHRLAATADARRHYTEALELLARLEDSPENRKLQADAILKRVESSLLTDSVEGNLTQLRSAEALLAAEDTVPRARAHYLTGRVHFISGNPREAIQAFRQVLPVAEAVGDPELLALPSTMLGTAFFSQGHLSEAARLLRQSLGPLDELGLRYEAIRARAYLGITLVGMGRIAEGMAEIKTAEQHVQESNQLTVTTMFRTIRCGAWLLYGDSRALMEEAELLEKLAEQSGEGLIRYLSLNFRAWGLCRAGRLTEAEQIDADASRLAAELGGRVLLPDWWAVNAAEIALRAGRAEEALERAQKVAETSRAQGLLFSLGLAERICGQAVVASDAADSHMQESIRAFRSGHFVLEVAQTEIAWALLLRRRGEIDLAQAQLASALAQLRASGCDDALLEAQRRWELDQPSL